MSAPWCVSPGASVRCSGSLRKDALPTGGETWAKAALAMASRTTTRERRRDLERIPDTVGDTWPRTARAAAAETGPSLDDDCPVASPASGPATGPSTCPQRPSSQPGRVASARGRGRADRQRRKRTLPPVICFHPPFPKRAARGGGRPRSGRSPAGGSRHLASPAQGDLAMTQAKHQSPSRLRYNAAHRTLGVHVSLPAYERLVALREASGLSFGQLVLATLGDVEVEVEVARRAGYGGEWLRRICA